jgi:hypothetical protein
MRNQFLRLDKACSENWENMKPNATGNFCEHCAKSVIDFTQLSQHEIAHKLKQSNGNICARVTQKQLDLPLLDLEIQNSYKLPYANIAAGLMVATALVTAQPTQARTTIQTEMVQTSNKVLRSNKINPVSKPDHPKPNDFTTFKGRVYAEDGKPVHNAKITLVTTKKFLTAYTSADGTFALEIPNSLIDDANVIRVSYDDVKTAVETDARRRNSDYETTNHILTKAELNYNYKITAEQRVYYLGGIRAYSEEQRLPIVIRNGVEMKFKDFNKVRYANHWFENKDYYHFYSETAIAIYGEKAKYGLYILIDQPTK